jgi:hypothetical protein
VDGVLWYYGGWCFKSFYFFMSCSFSGERIVAASGQRTVHWQHFHIN